jgi:hypothetical protein
MNAIGARDARADRTRVPQLLALTQYVGLIGFSVATMVQFLSHGDADWERRMLENGLVWLVGVQGFVFASGHVFFADRVADSIGWPRGNPFQFEVGLANLALGVLGVFAPGYDRDWWLAAIVAFAVFYFGAAIGHIRQAVTERNFAPGNVGGVLLFDVAAPALLIVLYLVTG